MIASTLALLLAATPAEERAIARTREYLAIDTTNPPGNELKGAHFLARELQKSGLEHEVITIAEDRANVWAILKGDGSKRPLILTHHIDVVGADPSAWKYPPFSGALAGGEIWGRGALDMKTTGIVHLAVIEMLQAEKKKRTRDIIYLALADEEDGGLGALYIKDKRPELIRGAELLLNEGANIFVKDRKVTHYGVATTEKTLLWLELELVGEAGHGSIPLRDAALDKMIAALERVRRAKRTTKMLPSVEKYFAGIGRKPDPNHGPDAALYTNTISITSVQAGDKINIIPGRARATLDCRLVPGTDKENFMKELRMLLAEEKMSIRETLYFPTLESPPDSPLMDAIRFAAKKRDPRAAVVPMMLTGTTDSSVFREMGIVSYGFEAFALTDAELATQHGANERVSVENIKRAIEMTYDIVAHLVY
jgi:acetylornithine deacetylase/succinyl-diaminopimelate desuccinylase-like protein